MGLSFRKSQEERAAAKGSVAFWWCTGYSKKEVGSLCLIGWRQKQDCNGSLATRPPELYLTAMKIWLVQWAMSKMSQKIHWVWVQITWNWRSSSKIATKSQKLKKTEIKMNQVPQAFIPLKIWHEPTSNHRHETLWYPRLNIQRHMEKNMEQPLQNIIYKW